jgi:predicted nuclease of restriction endonuclease-like (RecB) superfamily
MAKKSSSTPARPTAKRGAGYPFLVKAISEANKQLVTRVATVANQALVLRNWLVGAYIVEFEQKGADRAKYGARLLETLAEDLREKGIKGLDSRTLRNCRAFFHCYPQIWYPVDTELLPEGFANQIRSPVDSKSQTRPISQLLLGKSETKQISSALLTKLALPVSSSESIHSADAIRQAVVAELPTPLKPEQLAHISWAHFLELIRLDDPWQRAFYENELLKGHWSKRQLQRQIGSLLYERTGLSTHKKAVIERARKQEPQESIADVLRDPYILEFTGLAELPSYSEDQMESALLDHLQRFLLELGQGFCFEARQFRMTEGRRHHRVDLVFYHRILRCHVLIDLKIRAFKPEDAGQMNFYVNWFRANMTQHGDNPPVGILLCSGKDSAEVEFATAGMDNKLFVSRYLKALPSAAQLKAFLERDRAEIKALTVMKSKR